MGAHKHCSIVVPNISKSIKTQMQKNKTNTIHPQFLLFSPTPALSTSFLLLLISLTENKDDSVSRLECKTRPKVNVIVCGTLNSSASPLTPSHCKSHPDTLTRAWIGTAAVRCAGARPHIYKSNH